ncbi:10939_t:CDS:2 [Entrophospora sp. SA101]|nr:10939_t:CDS:2 [Entrophospora sp. SA101]
MALVNRIMRVNRTTTAFLLCDIQERFSSYIYQFPSLVTTAKKMNFKNIHTICKNQKVNSNKINNTIIFTYLIKHPKVKDLDIKNAKVVAEKTKFSMFVPEIENALKNHNIKSIVLFGIEAHVCILQTALDLIENNYDIHVLADGVSSMNYPEIEIALNHIQQAGGSVTSSESILFQLLNDSSDQKFKQISSLVKEYRKETSENKLMFKSNL